jgi:hypothetical protein
MPHSTRDENEDRDTELALEKSLEQEPRRGPPHNYRSRERMAARLAMTGTPDEARIARGLPASTPALVPLEKPWRPADGGDQ